MSALIAILAVAALASVPAVGHAQETPPAPSPPEPPPTLEKLAERIRALEELNKKLSGQLETTSREQAEFKRRLGGGENQEIGENPIRADRPADSPTSPVPDYTEGLFGPRRPAPGYEPPSTTKSDTSPLRVIFGPGFQFFSENDKFRLEIHYESQVEGRIWGPDDSVPPNGGVSGIYLPRQRIFFNGNITEPIEYEFAINRGLNNINVLNAFLNFHVTDEIEVRAGRFFTPFSYEQYAISNYWLLVPERSIFTTNLSPNRQFGVMGWGYLFEKRFDYAAGVFNGSRNSFENVDNNLDGVAYVNARPFQQSDIVPFARFLNLGTSVAFGRQDQPPAPVAFRIAGGSPDTNIPGPATVTFLTLNPDVIERGDRLVGSVHAAYFWKSLSLIGEWQYGYGNYASLVQPAAATVPFSGYYAAGGYFLTGEEVERRTRVKPLRPLVPTRSDSCRGIGAWEVTGRVSELRLGDQVFTSGFADPRVWSNSATTTEVGLNWYWNEYLKFYMFWLHGRFGDPVQTRPGEFQKSVDMVWLRAQLYF